ncbi:MAG TPA: hypothetical protein VH306_09370 [Gaiellaceae bacterium]
MSRPAKLGRGAEQPSPARTIVLAGLVLTAVALCVQTAGHLLNEIAFDGRYASLNAGADGSAFDWASSSVAFAAAGAAALRAACFVERRMVYASLAAVLGFLSLDDVVGLHDKIERAPGAWSAAAFAVILGAAVVLLVIVSRETPKPALGPLVAGLGLLVVATAARLVAAGVGLETYRDWSTAQRALGVVLVQDADLGGWSLVAVGLAAALCTSLVAVRGISEELPVGTNGRDLVAAGSRR